MHQHIKITTTMKAA